MISSLLLLACYQKPQTTHNFVFYFTTFRLFNLGHIFHSYTHLHILNTRVEDENLPGVAKKYLYFPDQPTYPYFCSEVKINPKSEGSDGFRKCIICGFGIWVVRVVCLRNDQKCVLFGGCLGSSLLKSWTNFIACFCIDLWRGAKVWKFYF